MQVSSVGLGLQTVKRSNRLVNNNDRKILYGDSGVRMFRMQLIFYEELGYNKRHKRQVEQKTKQPNIASYLDTVTFFPWLENNEQNDA